VDPGLAGRVAALLGELGEEAADRRLVARLEEIRLREGEVNVKGDRYAREKAVPEYRKAFADYGLRVGMAPAEAAALLRGRPPAVRGPAVAALSSWLFLAAWNKTPEEGWLGRVLSAADPDDWRQRVRAAWGRRDRQALEELAREVKVAAQPPQALEELGQILDAGGMSEARVRLLRRAQEAYPGDFWINQGLGMALLATQPPQLDEAVRFLTAAVALRPRSAGARLNLGRAFFDRGRLDEAIAAFGEAARLKRDYATAHASLGAALQRKGQLDKAIASYREAIALRPGYAEAHSNLGVALGQWGDQPGAAACFRAALAIDPKYGMAHYNLGNALLAQGDLPGAAACYRRALQAEPGHAEAHCNLGHALLHQGDFRGALAAYRAAGELGSRRKDWPYPTDQWAKQCQRFLELDGRRLPAILKGEAHPADAAERLNLAALCRYKGLYAASVRFYTEAFADDAKLADDFRAAHRCWAAGAAALGGRGEGEEAARLRRQALGWLRADLARLARELEGGTPQGRAAVQAALRHWQTDHALAGVRDAGPLAALPPAERAAWQQLWADVAATQALGGGAAAPPARRR
jgi:tetratricopeptide (TPR) repeat protein